MGIQFQQYYWNGSKFSRLSGTIGTYDFRYDLEFDPNPNEVGKSIEIPFRISTLGLASNSGRRRLSKGKWRKKIKTEFSLTGECDGTMRRKLEWAASRWSKWLILETNINTPVRFVMDTPEPDHGNAYSAANNEWVYVVFTTIDFTQTSKVNWYRYTIKVTRVDKRDIDTTEPGTYY